MAKFDATRNYYADLELSPSASSEDIKKQFRKLGMYQHCATTRRSSRRNTQGLY